jgi:hypothetical protein
MLTHMDIALTGLTNDFAERRELSGAIINKLFIPVRATRPTTWQIPRRCHLRFAFALAAVDSPSRCCIAGIATLTPRTR